MWTWSTSYTNILYRTHYTCVDIVDLAASIGQCGAPWAAQPLRGPCVCVCVRACFDLCVCGGSNLSPEIEFDLSVYLFAWERDDCVILFIPIPLFCPVPVKRQVILAVPVLSIWYTTACTILQHLMLLCLYM